MSRLRRYLFIVLGLLLTGIGVLGIITPVLPTTVFFLMAAGLFLRASPRLHRWIRRSRITGPFLKAYTEGAGLSRRRKTGTIAFLWVTLAISAWVVRGTPWLLILLGLVGIGVTVHVATIHPRKTIGTLEYNDPLRDAKAVNDE